MRRATISADNRPMSRCANGDAIGDLAAPPITADASITMSRCASVREGNGVDDLPAPSIAPMTMSRCESVREGNAAGDLSLIAADASMMIRRADREDSRLAVAGDLLRPAPLIAAGVLALNDHVLKGGAVSGAVTGKLSDLAGLFVAPIVAVCAVRMIAPIRRDGRVAAACVLAVAAVFALLKSSPAVNAAINSVWGHHALDPSDLYCLPMTLLAWVWLVERERSLEQPTRRFHSAIAFAAVLMICAATPAPPPVPPPNVPMWSIATTPLVLPCGTAEVWVSKSGKTGIGITVHVTANNVATAPSPSANTVAVDPSDEPAPNGTAPNGTAPNGTAPAPNGNTIAQDPPPPATAPMPTTLDACAATVQANLAFPDKTFPGTLVLTQRASEMTREQLYRDPTTNRVPDPRTLDGTYYYLGFQLDNEARWNANQRAAVVNLEIFIAGQKHTFALPATHAYREFSARRRW